MGRSVLNEVEHRIEHSSLRTVARVSIELGVMKPEEFVGAIDQMNMHDEEPATFG